MNVGTLFYAEAKKVVEFTYDIENITNFVPCRHS